MSAPIDLLDEIDKLVAAYSLTKNAAYLAEARCRVTAAGQRLERAQSAVAAIELELERMARVAAEESR